MKTNVFKMLCAAVATLVFVAAFSSCKKKDEPSKTDSYIENGVNYGEGITIAGVTWAPVNCGTDASHPTGLLYQWGRKDGHGNEGEANAPIVHEGPTDAPVAGTFYTSKAAPWDWKTTPDRNLWNQGSETSPVKTEKDPCPQGWRVPTKQESETLLSSGVSRKWNSSKKGCDFSEGAKTLFLPAAGVYYYEDGMINFRGQDGRFWTSTTSGPESWLLFVSKVIAEGTASHERGYGYSVRCVRL